MFIGCLQGLLALLRVSRAYRVCRVSLSRGVMFIGCLQGLLALLRVSRASRVCRVSGRVGKRRAHGARTGTCRSRVASDGRS